MSMSFWADNQALVSAYAPSVGSPLLSHGSSNRPLGHAERLALHESRASLGGILEDGHRQGLDVDAIVTYRGMHNVSPRHSREAGAVSSGVLDSEVHAVRGAVGVRRTKFLGDGGGGVRNLSARREAR